MILLLHGKDTFRSLRKYRQIREQAERKHVDLSEYDFDPQLLDARRALEMLDQLQTQMSTPLLFGGTQFFIVRRLGEQPKSVLQKAQSILKEHTDRESVVVLFLEYQALPKKHTLYTALHKVFHVKEEHFSKLDEKGAVSFVRGLGGEEYGLQIDADAAKHLWELCGNDLFGVSNALHKLRSYDLQLTHITREYIIEFFGQNTEEKIFELSRALLQQNPSEGLRVLDSLERQGEEGLAVHGFLLSQLKKALFIKDMRRRGETDYSVLGGNPKGLQILDRQAHHRSYEEIRSQYFQLIDLDEQIKHGERDALPALREFVARLS